MSAATPIRSPDLLGRFLRTYEHLRINQDSVSATRFDIDTIPSDFFAAKGISALHDFSQEVRALSAGEGPFKWLVGGYYNARQDRRLR